MAPAGVPRNKSYIFVGLKFSNMASVRNLKKDIEYLVFEVVSDCFTFAGLHPGRQTEELTDIIEDAVQLRNDLFSRINGADLSAAPEFRKAHFNEVRKDLFTGVDRLFDRLSEVTRSK